jgi:hypothetical protein
MIKMKKLNDLFDISYGTQLDFNKMEINSSAGVNFVTRSRKNLGVKDKVNILPNVKPIQGGTITVALGGSVLSSFVQLTPYYTGQNIKILTPKIDMSIEDLIYYCICIEKNKFRYSSHGREANITLDSLLVPDKPKNKVLINNNIDSEIEKISKKIKESFDLKKYKPNFSEFYIKDIFEVLGSTTTPEETLKSHGKGKYPYVTTTSENFGQKGKYNYYTDLGHILTVESAIRGTCFYQKENFSASDHVEKLIPKEKVTSEFLIYVSVLINQQNLRFSYGRKANQERIRELKILLPSKNKTIDYDYIDLYIQNLNYSNSLMV